MAKVLSQCTYQCRQSKAYKLKPLCCIERHKCALELQLVLYHLIVAPRCTFIFYCILCFPSTTYIHILHLVNSKLTQKIRREKIKLIATVLFNSSTHLYIFLFLTDITLYVIWMVYQKENFKLYFLFA